MLAALGITGPLASRFSGVPHSSSPLGRPWDYEPPFGYNDSFKDEDRRRGRRDSRDQKNESPWLGFGSQQAGEVQQSMFNSPQNQGHSSNASPEIPGSNAAGVKTSPNVNVARPQTSSSAQENTRFSNVNALPPVAALAGNPDRGAQNLTAESPSAWRSTGIHSILNPTSDLGGSNYQSSSGPISSTASEQRSRPLAQDLPLPTYTSPRIRKRGEPHSSGYDVEGRAPPRSGRRILTPRSPGIRAASLGSHRSPSLGPGMTIHAPSNHSDARLYTAEPGERHDSVIPPMPSLMAPRSTLPTIQSTGPASAGFRRAVPPPPTGNGYATGTTQASPPSAPEPVQSAYRHPATMSPSFPQSQGPSPPTARSSSNLDVPLGFGSMPVPVSRPGHNPSHGWKLALEGGDIGVEVDNQQASKMADEKRKRNAGASARFRARRKEKEKEASQTISGLQQELREMADARDFYLNERNYYRDLWTRNNTGPVAPRPTSPQYRRIQRAPTTGHDSDISSDYGRQESLEAMPPQRHPTSDFQPLYAQGGQSTTTYSTPFQPQVAPPYSFQNGPAQVPPTGPPSNFQDPRPGPSSNPQLPPPPRSGPSDPFRQDPFDRNWKPGK